MTAALGLGLWLAMVVFLRVYRIWLLYYLVAVGGTAVGLALAGRGGLDAWLAVTIARSVHLLGGPLGLPTQTFDSAPGTLLVLVIEQQAGWTALHIGVESSGLLELSVLVSLLLWYPGWQFGARMWRLALGLVATWAANVLRVLLIAGLLHHLGKGALALAHTYLGKGLFFALVIGILWWLLSAATVARLQPRA